MINLWTPDILKINTALKGQMRLVGGCVRDFLINKMPDDIDIATPLLPKVVLSCLQKYNIHSKLIAPRHGVILAVIGKNTYEITTLRQETYTLDNKEEITFIQDYEKDSLRRDFTINALYMDKDNHIYDYHNGSNDLKEKHVCFIGEPLERLRQDPLRILRYLRFWGNFGKAKPDERVLSCFLSVRQGLKNISHKRKQKEMSKILTSKRSSEVLNLIDAYHLWPFIASDSKQRITSLTPKEILTYIGE